MKDKLKICVLLLMAILPVATAAIAQKRDDVKPPPQTASLAETQKWFVDSFVKYATYKTRVTAVTTSDAKFDGCAFQFSQVRKSGSVSTATMGATRTTNSVKEDISFDVSRIANDGVSVSDHIYPEIQTLELKFTDDTRIVEIVIKREAADALKAGLIRIRNLCMQKN